MLNYCLTIDKQHKLSMIMAESRPIKILHIASGDLWAGAEVQLYTLAQSLSDRADAAIHVILLNHGKLEQKLAANGIDVTVIDETKLNGAQILRALIIAMRELKPDVIHTHRIKENILGSIAAVLSGNIPSVKTIHGAAEHKASWYQIPKRLILLLDWFCGRFLQKRVFAVSEELADKLQQDYPRNRITIIKNGVDVKSLISINDQPNHTEEASFRLGIVGRLVPVKRVDLFIEAANYLLQSQPDLHISFHIYGEGPLADNLKKLSNNLKTEDIVHFEGHSDNIHKDLKTLDALVMTSDHEGLPMTLLEAMALQVPIIAHAVGGIPDVLDCGKCGILVTEHSASGYALAISRLLHDSSIRTNNRVKALERVCQHYSAEDNAINYYIQYKALSS